MQKTASVLYFAFGRQQEIPLPLPMVGLLLPDFTATSSYICLKSLCFLQLWKNNSKSVNNGKTCMEIKDKFVDQRELVGMTSSSYERVF